MADNGVAQPVERELASVLTTTTGALPQFGFLTGSKGEIRSQDPVLAKELRYRLEGYRDLERDAKVFATLQKRYDMTVNAPLQVLPGLSRSRGVRAAERRARDRCIAQLDAMGISFEVPSAEQHANLAAHFDALQIGLLDAVLMGFAVGEVMWERDGREVYVREVRLRDVRRFVFDVEHRLRLRRAAFAEGETVPARKFLAYTFGSNYDPYGLSVAHRLYWPVYFKRKDLTFWLRFLDKYGGPTSVGKYPPGTPRTGEGSQETLLSAAAAIQSESAVVIPDNMMLELLQAITTAAQQGYDQLANYLDDQIAQAILGVTLTSEVRGQASRAASETHAHQQRTVGYRDARLLMNFLSATLCRWITDFNDGPDVAAPRLRKLFPDLSGQKEQVTIDAALHTMGYRRKLASVNDTYAYGEEVYEQFDRQPMEGVPGEQIGVQTEEVEPEEVEE